MMQKLSLSDAELDRLHTACADGEEQPLKEGEVLRRRKSGGVWVVQACKDGLYALSPPAFAELQRTRVTPSSEPSGGRALRLATELMIRDGKRCFYCDLELAPETATVEHLLPRSCGGSDDLANLALACRPCNEAARDRPIVQKVRFRDERRLRRSAA